MGVILLNQMPDVDGLLDTDNANVPETKKLLAAFHPGLPEAINMPASLYTTLARVLAGSEEDSRDVRAYNEAARSLGAKKRAESRCDLSSPQKEQARAAASRNPTTC